jgi:hypothetical protein
MRNNVKKQRAIIDLHEKGFTDDFQLIGNDLLWVQEKIYLRSEDFLVLEGYKFVSRGKSVTSSDIILGIHSLGHNAKGILIRYVTNKRATEGFVSSKIKKTAFKYKRGVNV